MRRLSEAPLDLVVVNINSATSDGARSSSVVSLPAGNGVSTRLGRTGSMSTDKERPSPTTSIDSQTHARESAPVSPVFLF